MLLQLEINNTKPYNTDTANKKETVFMKNGIKKALALLTLVSVVGLNACSDNAAKTETTTPEEKTTVSQQQSESSLARTVEIDRGNGYKDTYEFNEKGLLVKEDYYAGCTYGGEGNGFNFITRYVYDETNKIIRYSTTYSNGKTDHYFVKYNENGKPIRKEWHKDSADNLYSYEEYKYDEAGNLTGVYHFYDNALSHYYEYSYDDNGNLEKERSDGEEFREKHYTYDSNNLLVSSVTYSRTREILGEEKYENGLIKNVWYIGYSDQEKATFTYEYDSDGNMIKKIWHDSEEVIDGLLTGKKVEAVQYYEYENSRMTKSYGEGDEYPTTYEYFDNGNITKETSYNEDGSIYSIETSVSLDVMGNMKDIPNN